MAKSLKYKDTLKGILRNSGLVSFCKYNGTVALADLDSDTSDLAISNTNIIIDDNGPALSFSYTDLNDIITSIELKYSKIIPEDNVYSEKIYMYRTDGAPSGINQDNFNLSGKSEYINLLDTAYALIGEDKPYSFEADGIRDSATAERLARLIIKLHFKPMAIVEFEATYSLLKMEIGDKINFDSTLAGSGLVLPASFIDKIFIVSGIRVYPNVGSDPSIKITAIELGTANLPTTEEWIEVGHGGSEKIETGASGTIYTEAGNG